MAGDDPSCVTQRDVREVWRTVAVRSATRSTMVLHTCISRYGRQPTLSRHASGAPEERLSSRLAGDAQGLADDHPPDARRHKLIDQVLDPAVDDHAAFRQPPQVLERRTVRWSCEREFPPLPVADQRRTGAPWPVAARACPSRRLPSPPRRTAIAQRRHHERPRERPRALTKALEASRRAQNLHVPQDLRGVSSIVHVAGQQLRL